MGKYKDKFWILLGIIAAIDSYFLADYFDAPGIIIVGISIGFVLVLYGLYKGGKVKGEYIFPYGYIFFGVVACVFTIVLYLDGEFNGDTNRFLLLLAVGVIGIVFGVIQYRGLKKKEV